MEPICRTCRHFFPIPKPAHLPDEEKEKLPQLGQCRARAPAVGFAVVPKMSVEHQGMIPVVERCTAFPSVHDDVYCGEYSAKIQQ